MTTYNTYQEAKIANPECEIYQLERNGLFAHCDHHKAELVRFIEFDSAGIKCNPADYCMTLERFLSDGLKLEIDDVILDEFEVEVVSSDFYCMAYNKPDSVDSNIYILRAAALEEPEPELTKDDSPQGVISAISNRLHNMGCEHQDSELGEELGSMACDIWGVLPMISNESIEEKKPHTKVEYVKVVDSIFDLRPDFEAGDLYISHCDGHYQQILSESSLHLACAQGLLYRRIETPMTWKEELYDYLDNSCEMSDDFDGSFTIGIEGKPLEFNLNDDEFVDMCKFVASLNSVN